jgi:hypothetical protein
MVLRPSGYTDSAMEPARSRQGEVVFWLKILGKGILGLLCAALLLLLMRFLVPGLWDQVVSGGA